MLHPMLHPAIRIAKMSRAGGGEGRWFGGLTSSFLPSGACRKLITILVMGSNNFKIFTAVWTAEQLGIEPSIWGSSPILLLLKSRNDEHLLPGV
jgi:hypothetical protein